VVSAGHGPPSFSLYLRILSGFGRGMVSGAGGARVGGRAAQKDRRGYPQDTAIKVEPKSKKQLEQVWELAMIAYSGYGVLLPWAAYVCYHDPSLRPSFSWAMTALMCTKFFPSHPMVASKGNASLFCSCIFLPTGVTQSTRRSLIVEQNIIPSCLHYEHNMLAVTPSIGHPGHPALRLHGSFGYCG